MKPFRLLSLIEGCSLLVLLLIAMPMKYLLGIDGIVFFAGLAHGVLFICYLISSMIVSHKLKWSILQWFGVFLAGILPFGFLVVDKAIKREEHKACYGAVQTQ